MTSPIADPDRAVPAAFELCMAYMKEHPEFIQRTCDLAEHTTLYREIDEHSFGELGKLIPTPDDGYWPFVLGSVMVAAGRLYVFPKWK